jgi:hypothetical protein
MTRGNVFFDTTYYAHWAHGTLTGTRIPYRDFAWEYPPVALPAMLLPGLYAPLMSDGRDDAYLWLYGLCWVAAMLLVDAWILGSLVRRTAAGARPPAVTVWVWGLPLLGALSWARYDLLPAATAAAALLASGAGESGRAGALSGLGAGLKLWPSLLAPLQVGRREAGTALVRAAAVVGATAAATFAVTGSTGFTQVLSYQSRRGLQCESLAALPFLWLRHLHVAHYRARFRFGAWEVTGAHIGAVTAVTTTALVAGLVVLALNHWRLLRRGPDASSVALTSMAVMLLVLVTNKVFSPQYLLWVIAVLAAACVLDPVTWRPFVPPVLLACALTDVAFPWFYSDVTGTSGWVGLLALTARDLVVVAIVGHVVVLLLRGHSTRGRPVDDSQDEGGTQHEAPHVVQRS